MKFSLSLFFRLPVLATGLLLMNGAAASAAPLGPVYGPITVNNFSFETNSVTDGNSTSSINDWVTAGNAFTFNPSSSDFTGAAGSGTPTGGDGAQSAFLQDVSSLRSSADLTNLASNTSYSLTVAIGRIATNDIGDLQVGFLVNGAFVSGSSATFAGSTVATAGRFQDYTFNFTPTATDIGKGLRISLGQLNDSDPSNRAYFDKVRLTSTAVAPVPEPSTWAMMALGVGAIGLVSRKRKRAGDVI